VQRCFAAATVVGGFNRKWGLPLPQTTAIEAGSIFTYQVEAPIPFAALEVLEQNGIGERRAEGFGRVVVNGFMQPRYESKCVELSDTTQPPEVLSSIEESLAETIADRLLRNALDIELRRKINTIKLEKPPTKNQLARLRVILRDMQTGGRSGESIDRDRWKQYLDSLEARRSTSEQFKRARVDENEDKYPLLTWLKEQIEQAQQKWLCEPVRLGSDDVSVQAEVDTALAEEYALRLLDGVLSAAYKEQK
jgi:CRISPR-associated protein Csx10